MNHRFEKVDLEDRIKEYVESYGEPATSWVRSLLKPRSMRGRAHLFARRQAKRIIGRNAGSSSPWKSEDVVRLAAKPGTKRIVVYVGSHPSFDFINSSIALRKTGNYRTILMISWSNLAQKAVDWFDVVWVYKGVNDLAKLLSSIDPWIVHVQGGSEVYPYPVIAKLATDSPVISNIHHMPALSRTDDDPEASHETKTSPPIDQFVESFMYRYMSGITAFNYGANIVKKAQSAYESTAPVIAFRNYIVDEMRPSSPIPLAEVKTREIVHTGVIAQLSAPFEMTGDMQYLRLARRLEVQGVNFHIYPPPHVATFRQRSLLKEYVSASKASEYFHYHNSVEPHLLSDEIQQYGYGSVLPAVPLSQVPAIKRHWDNGDGMPSKIFGYISAGLPIIVGSVPPGVAQIVKDHEIGIIVSDGDVDDIATVMDSTDYARLRKNMPTAIEYFRMDNHISRLIELYENANG